MKTRAESHRPAGHGSAAAGSAAAEAALARALRHVKAERMDQAIRVLTAERAAIARHGFALNLLGLLYVDRGRFAEAVASFDAALLATPGWADAHANRAAALQRIGRHEEALADLDALVAVGAADATVHFNRGAVLKSLSRLPEAEAAFSAALRLAPRYVAAAAALAAVQHERGALDEALGTLGRALILHPEEPEVHFHRATLLKDLGRLDDAEAAYHAALHRRPDWPEAWSARAILATRRQRPESALRFCAEALARDPACFTARFHEANVLHSLKAYDEALCAYDAALALVPGHWEVLCNRGATLFEMNRLEEALADFDAALAGGSAAAALWSNRGNALQRLHRLAEAEASFDRALALRPAYGEARVNRGVVLKLQGRFAEACADFDAALALDPEDAHARNNRGALRLLLGDFAGGWEDYEARWLAEDRPRPRRRRRWPEWGGPGDKARSVLVLDEQGLGDVLHFCRYLPLIEAAGAAVTFACRQSLHRLLRSLSPTVDLIVPGCDPERAIEAEVGLVSLPRAFATRLDTIPAVVPYLAPEPARVRAWADRLPRRGLRVGIAWQGNLDPRADTARSVPLDALAPLAAVPGVALVSLQKGAEGARTALPGLITLDGLDTGPDAFVDTAAVMAGLDLVVTCDTSLAHLAGALGRPVFVALRAVPDWRWLMQREGSPWYPTMSLFRQTAAGEWAGVFTRIAARLAALAAARETTV